MNEAETLVKKITEGIQEKKGKNIVIADPTMHVFFIWSHTAPYLDNNTVIAPMWGQDRKSTRLNSSHWNKSRMPSSA